MSELPLECHVNEEGSLHKDGGPSIAYADGFAMYHLNGVEVSKEIAEMPAEQVTKEMILREGNADVAREIVRKIGLARATEILDAKCVDTFETETGGKYELLMIAYDGREPRPYLKMHCSSSGEAYILGARPEHKTARAAYLFLNNLKSLEEGNFIWES
ncbi:MAG: hypothetical protein HC883_00495 [Bdellovibrionaceae bacterium]|nr:hypothetical protein [Pseudobdellovibrionaceae bacterium]